VRNRIVMVAALVLIGFTAAAGALYYFEPSLFFELLDPRGPTVRQALGSLAATAATAAFTKYIVQHEYRAAREQAETSAMGGLLGDASSIVRAFAEVQEDYEEDKGTPTLVDRAARLIGRKQEIVKGIDQINWGVLLSIAGSEGAQAQLQFLSQMIPPDKIEPISQYLRHRADFAFELKQANADGQLDELYAVLFAGVEQLTFVDSMPLLDTRLMGFSVLASLKRLLEAMQNLELSVDRLDETIALVDLAYDRVDGYFESLSNAKQSANAAV
jgi:hypothetical protein